MSIKNTKKKVMDSKSKKISEEEENDLHVMRGIKHLHYEHEYEPLGKQLISLEKGKFKNDKSFRKKQLNITMIVRSDDFPFYKRHYNFNSKHDDGCNCIIRGKATSSSLESGEFFRHSGVIHEGYPTVNKIQLNAMLKDFKNNSQYIAENIKNDIKKISRSLKIKRKMLEHYQSKINYDNLF